MLNRTYEDDSPPDERLGRGVLIGHPRLPTTPLFPSQIGRCYIGVRNTDKRVGLEAERGKVRQSVNLRTGRLEAWISQVINDLSNPLYHNPGFGTTPVCCKTLKSVL